jgi:threonine/homoserine/homoserine lactone efflux protein
MPLDLLIALTVVSCVMAFTPGPNNIMLAASGVNFGFTHTIPHMLGATLGFDVLLIACAAGLGIVFAALPQLHLVLKVGGALYMLWLAWKVATAHVAAARPRVRRGPSPSCRRPAFQSINPKAVVAALSAIALYVRPGQFGCDFPVMLAILTVCTVGSVMTWTGFGVALRRLLRNRVYARIFNVSMALLLAAGIVPMLT